MSNASVGSFVELLVEPEDLAHDAHRQSLWGDRPTAQQHPGPERHIRVTGTSAAVAEHAAGAARDGRCQADRPTHGCPGRSLREVR
jgi:hypothetical protein